MNFLKQKLRILINIKSRCKYFFLYFISIFFKNIINKKYLIENTNNILNSIENYNFSTRIKFLKRLIGKENFNLFMGLICFRYKINKLSLCFFCQYKKINYFNNEVIDKIVIKNMLYLNTSPSEADNILYYIKHDDIYLSNWRIGHEFIRWVESLELNKNIKIDYNKQINIYVNYPSFISTHLFISLIFVKKGFKVNFFYSTDLNSISKTTIYEKYIIEKEINFINLKNYEFIDFIKIDTNINYKKSISENIYKEVMKITFIDLNYFSKKYFNLFNNLSKLNFEEEKIFKIRKLRNINIANFINSYIDRKENNHRWIFHNGTNVETGALLKVLNHYKIDYTTFEFSLIRKKIFFSYNSIVTKRLTKYAWENFLKIKINLKYLNQTKKIIKNIKHKFINNIDSNVKILNNIDVSKKTYILFANHPIETRYYNLDNTNYFFSVYDWVCETLDFLLKLNCNIIIRLHPSEINDISIKKNKKLGSLIKNKYKKKINKIIIIDKANFNTYNLFEQKNVCNLIYDSDIGLELILNNQNFISCSNTIYKSLDLGINPRDKIDYFDNLQKFFLSKNNKILLKQKKLAFKFFIFWYHYIMYDFPCFIGNSVNEINDNNIKEIFNNKKFANTFEAITKKPNYKGWYL